uniref:DDE Tnp4 domain-containing protein n=1 Tax=Oncorhynchus tshawytscha TaxID=74940 RepID=A0AAZ3SBJ8_ONCTS
VPHQLCRWAPDYNICGRFHRRGLNLTFLSISKRKKAFTQFSPSSDHFEILASGIFHHETSDFLHIKFPDSAGQAHYKEQFYEYGHFPGVIGCIDGCHVPIKCPSTPDAEEYRNSKNWFSINVQGNLEFSNIKGQHSGLLGDSGYGQCNFVFTPYINPTTAEQQRYNRAHIRMRGMVERMFGVWKNLIRCLRHTLRFKPRRCCKVVIATAVLHNYLKQHCCPYPPMIKQMCPWLRQAMTNEDLHTELLSHCSTSTR